LLIAEHSTAQAYALQADQISWQIGTIIISGALLTICVLLGSSRFLEFLIGSLFTNAIVFLWINYAEGQHQIMLIKLHRVNQIEALLHFEQNLFWDKK
jgi:hypothetical protein